MQLALPNGCRVARVPDGHGAWRSQMLAALQNLPPADEQWCPPAATTTSVDMSRTYLDWARRNMEINGFRGDAHRFVQMETAFGGRRVVDWLTGEQLPRIC